MDFKYNLQEAVSEECYNDIMRLVQENLEDVNEEQHAFATELERIGRKHAPGLLSSAAKGVSNTVKAVGTAATDAVAAGQSKFAKALKKLPGVRDSIRHRGSKIASAARKQNQTNFKTRQEQIKKNFDNDMNKIRYISDPKLAAQKTKEAQDRAYAHQTAAEQSYKNKASGIRANYKSYTES